MWPAYLSKHYVMSENPNEYTEPYAINNPRSYPVTRFDDNPPVVDARELTEQELRERVAHLRDAFYRVRLQGVRDGQEVQQRQKILNYLNRAVDSCKCGIRQPWISDSQLIFHSDVVRLLNNMGLEDEEKYGKEVAQRVREFLQYSKSLKTRANPFMITAVGRLYNFDKDRRLDADELAVLRQKLRALEEAFFLHVEKKTPPESIDKYIAWQFREYNLNLSKMTEYKNRIEAVNFMNDMKLLDADTYGEDVARKAKAFLRYWENHALPGKQV